MEKELHIVVVERHAPPDPPAWWNRLVGANGEIVMQSELYASRAVAIREAKKVGGISRCDGNHWRHHPNNPLHPHPMNYGDEEYFRTHYHRRDSCPWRSQCGTYGHDWCCGFAIGLIVGILAVVFAMFMRMT